jgi:lipopolysaccharide export system protein LptA
MIYLKPILISIIGGLFIVCPCLLLASSDERNTVEIDYTTAVYEFGGPIKKVFLTGPITIRTPSLKVTCDLAEVHSSRKQEEGSEAVSNMGTIDYILATGNVVISQSQSTAYAGRAEIFPSDKRLVLEEHPRIEDPYGTVSGHRIVFLQGERRIVVESGPDAERSRILLQEVSEIGLLMEQPAESSLPINP